MRVWILANNGETVCDEHLWQYGVSLKDHRDSRGRRALLVTPEIAQESIRDFGIHPKCEAIDRWTGARCACQAALVYVPQSEIISTR